LDSSEEEDEVDNHPYFENEDDGYRIDLS